MKVSKSIYFRNLFVIALLFSISNFYAQTKWDTKERVYEGGVLIQGLINADNLEIGILKPIGKNVVIKHDPFYNKYTIDWQEDNGPVRMILSVAYTAGNGNKVFVDSYNNNEDEYFIQNNIQEKNMLTLITLDVFKIDQVDYKMISIFDDIR